MKTHILKLLHFSLIGTMLFTSCKDDDPGNDLSTTRETNLKEVKNLPVYHPHLQKAESNKTVENKFVKFNFATGETENDNSDNWDIALKGTTIIVNGGTKTDNGINRTGDAGVIIVSKPFSEIKKIPTDGYKQDVKTYAIEPSFDKEESWYTYSMATHTASPKFEKTFIFRTHDGKYAKMHVTSFQKNNEEKASPENSFFYNFEYVYQPNKNATEFK